MSNVTYKNISLILLFFHNLFEECKYVWSIVHNGGVDNVKYCAVEKWKILKNKLCFNFASMFHHDPEGGPGFQGFPGFQC